MTIIDMPPTIRSTVPLSDQSLRLIVLEQAIKDSRREIEQAVEKVGREVVRIGEWLLESKSLVPHGQWETWVLGNVGISLTTARNYMNVAQRFKSATLAGYQQAALYILAAPSTPAPARDAAAQLAAGRGADDPVTSREAKVLKAAPDAIRQRYVDGNLTLNAVEGLMQVLRQPLKDRTRRLVETGQVSDPEVAVALDHVDDEELEVIEHTGAIQGDESIPLRLATARDLQRVEADRRRETIRQQQAQQRVTVCLGRKADVVAVDGDRVTIAMPGLGDDLPAGAVVYVTIEREK